jgi:hypothetical protein
LGYPLLDRIRLTIGCFVLALAATAGLFMGHHLSAVGFAVSVLVLAAAAGVVLTRFFRQARDLGEEFDPFRPPDERTLRRRVRITKITLAILTALLFLTLWKTRSVPSYSQWLGILFGVLCMIGLSKNLRHDQSKLKQLGIRRTT